MIVPSLPAQIGGAAALAIDHLGIAVPDLDQAIRFYREALGLAVGEIRDMPPQGIRVAFADGQHPHLELIAPIGDTSPVRSLLGRHTIQDFLAANPAGGLHHICFSTPDLGETCRTTAQSGIRLLSQGGPVVGASGQPIVFLDPADTSGVLIELKQRAY